MLLVWEFRRFEFGLFFGFRISDFGFEAAMSERVAIGVDPKVESRDLIVTRLDAAIGWARRNSCWPMPMGLA